MLGRLSDHLDIPLRERDGDIWHVHVGGLTPGTLYGYRVHGPYAPEGGHRFNPHKLLIDPYACQLSGRLKWSDAVMGYKVVVLDPDPQSPAGQVADVHLMLSEGGLDGMKGIDQRAIGIENHHPVTTWIHCPDGTRFGCRIRPAVGCSACGEMVAP